MLSANRPDSPVILSDMSRVTKRDYPAFDLINDLVKVIIKND